MDFPESSEYPCSSWLFRFTATVPFLTLISHPVITVAVEKGSTVDVSLAAQRMSSTSVLGRILCLMIFHGKQYPYLHALPFATLTPPRQNREKWAAFQVCLTAGEGNNKRGVTCFSWCGGEGSVVCGGCNLPPQPLESLWLATAFWILTSDWILYIVWLLAVIFFLSLLFWMCFIKIEKEFVISLNGLLFLSPETDCWSGLQFLSCRLLCWGTWLSLNHPKGKSILWWEPHWWQPFPLRSEEFQLLPFTF